MGLRDVGASLPPGFRFYPSDEELVCHYLYKKIAKEPLLKGTLVDIDLHTCEPWQLPGISLSLSLSLSRFPWLLLFSFLEFEGIYVLFISIPVHQEQKDKDSIIFAIH